MYVKSVDFLDDYERKKPTKRSTRFTNIKNKGANIQTFCDIKNKPNKKAHNTFILSRYIKEF